MSCVTSMEDLTQIGKKERSARGASADVDEDSRSTVTEIHTGVITGSIERLHGFR